MRLENKKIINSKIAKISLLAVAMLALLPNISSAQSYNVATLCSSLFGSSQALYAPFGSSTTTGVLGTVNTLLSLSLLILFLMLNIAALCYLIGSALRVDSLTNFGRTEIGEVALTAVIVVIFLGSFQVINRLPPPTNYLAISPTSVGYGIFNDDCLSTAGASLNVIGDIWPLWVAQDTINFVSNINTGFTWSNLGWSDKPYAGISLSATTLGYLTAALLLMVALPLAGAVILGLFFYVGPLFLFLGIILRTIPMTRAAGGTFLGLFVGFYLLFPLLIWLFVSQTTVSTLTASQYTTQGLLSAINPSIVWTPSYSQLGSGFVIDFVETIVGQVFYIVFAIILSLIISFDFMEAAGDVLGAPSLSSSQTLRKLI